MVVAAAARYEVERASQAFESSDLFGRVVAVEDFHARQPTLFEAGDGIFHALNFAPIGLELRVGWVRHDGNRSVLAEQPDGVFRRQLGAFDVGGAFAPYELVEDLIGILEVARLDHRAGYVRPADGGVARYLAHALPLDLVSHLVEAARHRPAPVESALPEAGERPLEVGVRRVYEVAQYVDFRARHVCTQLDGWDYAQTLMLLRGGEGGGKPLSGVVVADGYHAQAARGAQVD